MNTPSRPIAVVGQGSAVLSDCGTYRYELRRSWDTGRPVCLWVMLNPSTADADLDDPTIRRCRSFSSVGDTNDDHIHTAVLDADAVVCAWGAHPFAARRARGVTVALRSAGTRTRVRCLGVITSGAPRHPLYTPRVTELVCLGEVA